MNNMQLILVTWEKRRCMVMAESGTEAISILPNDWPRAGLKFEFLGECPNPEKRCIEIDSPEYLETYYTYRGNQK